MRRILVATDGSESANRAVDSAARLAKRLDATLLIVNAIDGNGLSAEEMTKFRQAEGVSLGDALAAMQAVILKHARDQAGKHGLSSVQTEARQGDPVEAVLDIVRKNGVDAVVVGRRGRGRVSGLLLGSISQKLVTLAPCTVIVVP
jgi:nucleotide-binding universal stress UspA family protein